MPLDFNPLIVKDASGRGGLDAVDQQDGAGRRREVHLQPQHGTKDQGRRHLRYLAGNFIMFFKCFKDFSASISWLYLRFLANHIF